MRIIVPEEGILFDGGITIFGNGEFFDEKARRAFPASGWYCIDQGEIFAIPRGVEVPSVERLVFGNAKTGTQREERIEMILKGYEQQREWERSNESARRHKSFNAGREAGALGYGL